MPPEGAGYAGKVLTDPNARRRGGTGRLIVAALVGALAVLALTGGIFGLLPSLSNPFTAEEEDRSQPPLLQALTDLSEYRAAEGQFQVIVDVEEGTRFVPSFLKGERTSFLALGSVAASVDFSSLGEDAIVVSEDGKSVRVTLPRAVLSDPTVDPEGSYVLDRDRGLLDRAGSMFSDNPTSERELYLLAEDKLAAAAGEADLADRAEDNTEDMLTTMLEALGYESVTVTFVDDPRA